jgi:cytochrome c-type protein NapB
MMEEGMKTYLAISTAAIFAVSATAVGAGEVSSLRGGLGLDAAAKMFSKKKVETVVGGRKRNWKLQPPTIPHKIGKERISLSENSCYRCHAHDTFKAEKAPMISKSHYKDPKNPDEKNLVMRRYYCFQCHVPQVEAAPLVENTFKSVDVK